MYVCYDVALFCLCVVAVSLFRTTHCQNSAGHRPLDWCAYGSVQVPIIMAQADTLFKMSTEQSVHAGHQAGLLERTEEPSL